MRVLVLNSGSSSLKFKILEVPCLERDGGGPRVLMSGGVNGIGGAARLQSAVDGSGPAPISRPVRDHAEAAGWLFEHLRTGDTGSRGSSLLDQIEAVGHRVVHGGDQFVHPVQVDPTVLAEIERLSELAPLHNPASLAGIRVAQTVLGADVPMVAVFDTTFHRSMPARASIYAIPQDLAARHRIRRYGFHGIAHASLAAGYSAFTARPLERTRLITLHLGNGCSITAIREGKSVDTSMGFSPLEGLVMGTRSGDLDPGIVSYVARREGVGADTVEGWLNERSGLLGVSGLSHDMRELLRAAQEEEHGRAILAMDLFCYRVRKYIGAYLAALSGADAVIFGGGIGEQAPAIRARICAGMEWCGLMLDRERNVAATGLAPGEAAVISREDAGLPAYVVAVDEEAWIARETARCLRSTGDESKRSARERVSHG